MTIGAWSQACLDLIGWFDTSVDINKSLRIHFTSRMRGEPYSGLGETDKCGRFLYLGKITEKRVHMNDADTWRDKAVMAGSERKLFFDRNGEIFPDIERTQWVFIVVPSLQVCLD